MSDALRLDRWSPALRRAVMAVRPAFFAWPAAQQARYGVELPGGDRIAIVTLLLESLQVRNAAVLARKEAKGRLALRQQNQINELLLPLMGMGDDAFYLNECLPDGTTLLELPTLRAYDDLEHAFQERALAAETPGYEPQPYQGRLFGRWARVLIDDRMVYLTLTLASGYLYEHIREESTDALQRLIPHRYVPGPDDGKLENGHVRWDSRIDAGGQEGLLEELQRRVWTYESERWSELTAEWAARGRQCTYILASSEPGSDADEQNLHIVFSDAEALRRVHFTRFMRDCRAIEQAADELMASAEVESARVKQFVEEQLADLRLNFDPKVARLRKRMRVLMHPAALDGLPEIDDD